MAYITQGRQSVTLPHGILAARQPESLNALLVVCHGWRSPARAMVERMRSAPGRWLNPLSRWTRPTRRAA